MRVLKRDGKIENLSLDNILYRLKGLSTNVKELRKLGLTKLENIDPDLITMSVVSRLYDNIPTSIIDEEAARISNSHTEHPEYSTLALRIIVSNHHRNTEECFSEVMEKLWDNHDDLGTHNPITNERFMTLVRTYKNELNEIPDYSLDYSLCYIGFQQLYKSYLLKKNTNINGKFCLQTIERPQHMYLRVALTLYKDNIEKVKELTEAIQINYHQSCVHTPILVNEEFIIDADLFNRILVASMVDKAKRIKRISSKESRNFTKIELYTHFETGVRSGGYLFFRKPDVYYLKFS